MCYGLSCKPGTDHSAGQEWAERLSLGSRQRLVREAIGTATVKEHIMGLLLGIRVRNNPRLRYWQQRAFSKEKQQELGTCNKPVGKADCNQCWVMKYTKLYYQNKEDTREVVKMCKQYIVEFSNMDRGLDQIDNRGIDHLVIFVLYAEAVIKAISLLMQSYQALMNRSPLCPATTRRDAEREYLLGGSPNTFNQPAAGNQHLCLRRKRQLQPVNNTEDKKRKKPRLR